MKAQATLQELAVYYAAWPRDFHELAHCWESYAETSEAPGSSLDEPLGGRNYGALFRRTGAESLRIYFGNEFCEHRIPSRAELEEAIGAVVGAGFGLTVLTPPCAEPALPRIENLLDVVETQLPGTEIVANDWGVLELIKSRRPRLTPVLGRLMNRFLRDPRVTPLYLRPDAPAEALGALQDCSISIPAYGEILSEFGVTRIELDFLYQGIATDFRALGLSPSVYLPFGYVSTGRICLFGNLNLRDNGTFQLREGCDAPCRWVEAVLTDPSPRKDAGIHTYLQRGNTFFYEHDETMVTKALDWTQRQGGRVVFQPELPF